MELVDVPEEISSAETSAKITQTYFKCDFNLVQKCFTAYFKTSNERDYARESDKNGFKRVEGKLCIFRFACKAVERLPLRAFKSASRFIC